MKKRQKIVIKNKEMKHPYVEYESSKVWMIVRSSVEELVENNDIVKLT